MHTWACFVSTTLSSQVRKLRLSEGRLGACGVDQVSQNESLRSEQLQPSPCSLYSGKRAAAGFANAMDTSHSRHAGDGSRRPCPAPSPPTPSLCLEGCSAPILQTRTLRPQGWGSSGPCLRRSWSDWMPWGQGGSPEYPAQPLVDVTGPHPAGRGPSLWLEGPSRCLCADSWVRGACTWASIQH